MKRADRLGAAYVLIVGEDEIKNRSVVVRNMQTKAQDTIPLDNIEENIKKIMGSSKNNRQRTTDS